MWQDIRYGLRLMGRSPAFSLAAVLVLSLGIGVNTALFSIVNALFFAPLPVKSPDELVYMYLQSPNGRASSMRREEIDSFAGLGATLADFARYSRGPRNLWQGETTPTMGELIDGRYFELLGVEAALGRLLGPIDDDSANTEPAIVISYDFWVRRFHANADVLGEKLRLTSLGGSTTHTIVGVTAAGFRGLSDPWSPTQFWTTFASSGPRQYAGVLVARLKPGTTVDRFRAFVETATATVKDEARRNRLNSEFIRHAPQAIDAMRFAVYRAVEVRVPSNPDAILIPARVLAALTTVVLLVLAIAATNVAGLLLARGVARTNEVGVRRAIGADGGRVARQLLTETVLLSLASGTLGLGVAWNLLAIFRWTTPSAFALNLSLDWRVLAFAGAVCLGTGVLVGLAPAFQAGRVNVLEALGIGSAGSGQTRARLRYWIVIPQIALSVVLLVVAGVHVRALKQVELADLGYATDGGIVLSARLWDARPIWGFMSLRDEDRKDLRERETTRAHVFSQSVLERVEALAGADRAALTSSLPFLAYMNSPDHVIGAGSDAKVNASQVRVSGGYFGALGIRLVSGRTFDSRDEPTGRKVAIVSRSLERRLWPTGGAIGKAIAFERPQPSSKAPEWLEIIGIVDDVMPVLGTLRDQPLVYRPAIQLGFADGFSPMFYMGLPATIVVRAQGDRGALISRIKAAVLGADAFAEVTTVRTSEQLVGEILYPRRVGAGILVAAGCVGLTLATLGLYALISYSIAQRRREIGIRTSLGASPRDLVRLVLRDAARIIAIGGGIGVVVAALTVRVTAGLVPGLPFIDMFALVGAPLVLTVVILAASYVPARRAGRIDPIEALRAN